MRQVRFITIIGLLTAFAVFALQAADKDPKKSERNAEAQQQQEQPSADKTQNSDTVQEINWRRYDEGLEVAEEENKHVFIDFTAKWCGWCKKMDKETFSEPEVIDMLNDHFVPVRVDGDSQQKLSVDGYKITEKNLTRSEFGVRGFPSFWFLKPDGTKLGKIDGYRNKEVMLKALNYIKDYKYDSTKSNPDNSGQ